MLKCKSVAECLADKDYADLPWRKRVGLRLHVLLCFVCGRYHRSVLRFQNAVRTYRRNESTRKQPPEGELRLRTDEKEQLRHALEEAQKSGQQPSQDGDHSPKI